MRKQVNQSEQVEVASASKVVKSGDELVIHDFQHRTVRRPRQIDFADILAASQVIADEEYNEAPWERCDGYEHESTSVRSAPDEWDSLNMQGSCWHTGNRERIVVTIDNATVAKWGIFDYCRARGASKQVAREMEAAEKRRSIARLCGWYSHGWESWGVTCDYYDAHDSLWGIDDYKYANEDVRPEVATNVADQLIEAGHEVIGYPESATMFAATCHDGKRVMTLDAWRDHYKRNLASDCWH